MFQSSYFLPTLSHVKKIQDSKMKIASITEEVGEVNLQRRFTSIR